MDMHCRDRWRMEVFKDGLILYVNGVKYFEDSGWPADRQLPDSFIDGPIYAYQTDWHNRAEDEVFRFHWDHFLVNPRDADDAPIPPTAAPSFCLGEPHNTCPMVFIAPEKPVPSKDQVDILDFVYGTPSITIKAGDTVTWTNQTLSGMTHTVTAADGSFDSGPIGVNKTYSRTFPTAGVYNYECLPHPSMTGTVVVVP